MNWADFFAMGGYGFYVWSSWGLTAIIFLVIVVEAKLANVKIHRRLERQLSREKLLKKP